MRIALLTVAAFLCSCSSGLTPNRAQEAAKAIELIDAINRIYIIPAK